MRYSVRYYHKQNPRAQRQQFQIWLRRIAILRERLGFGNPSQQSPNIILILGIAAFGAWRMRASKDKISALSTLMFLKSDERPAALMVYSFHKSAAYFREV
jgi:hypothetical protein